MKRDEKRDGRVLAAYADKLTALVRGLAEAGVHVGSLSIHGGIFGCWEIIAYKRREAMRIFWDGRDNVLTIAVSLLRPFSYPNEWREIENKHLNVEAGDDPLIFSESFMRQYFSSSGFKNRTSRST